MVNFDDIMLFGKKSFSDLLKDIYNNQKKTEQQISDMIMALKPYIQSAGDAVMIVPLIKEYMEVKVKNDDQLTKMAAIVQRAMSNAARSDENDFSLSEQEAEQLLLEVNKMGNNQNNIEKSVDNLPKQIEEPTPSTTSSIIE